MLKKIMLAYLIGFSLIGGWVLAQESDTDFDEQYPPVVIAPGVYSVEVNHFGQKIKIERIRDPYHVLTGYYAKTSRPCPPFCIQAIEAAPGVKTVGELEVIHFLTHEVKNNKGILIDARMPDWYELEAIPGSINLPFVVFTQPSKQRQQVLKLLGGQYDKQQKKWDFSKAPILMFYCNGMWCGQSAKAIQGLLSVGYPPEKLRYYRGGMQAWKQLGLTTVSKDVEVVGEDE